MRFLGMFRYTLAEAIRQGTLIFYAAVSTLILLVAAIGISQSPDGVTIFGKELPTAAEGGLNLVHIILHSLYSQSVFWIIVFGVFATAGLVPRMLDRGTAEVFLSKPLHRWQLLMSRSFGASMGIVLSIVFFQIGLFLIFGLRAGFWHPPVLLSAIALAYTFVMYFSVVTFVGLLTRSTGFTIMVSLAYNVVSWGLEERVHGLYRLWDNDIYHRILDGLYYLLPQVTGMLENCSRLVGYGSSPLQQTMFSFEPFLWSFGSAVLFYGWAARIFWRSDY